MERLSKRAIFGLSAVALFAVLEVAFIVAAVLAILAYGFGVHVPLVG